MSSKKSIYDRNLNRTRNAEVSRAAFAYLFSEIVSYVQKQVTGIADLEKRLNSLGYPIGVRIFELLLARPTSSSSSSGLNSSSTSTSAASSSTASASLVTSSVPTCRPTRILALLQFIHSALWRHLFGRPADALERSATQANEYMISDNDPLVNLYISVPREISQLNCAAFVAGIIEGVCESAGFPTHGVTAHWANDAEDDSTDTRNSGSKQMWPGKTIFLIKFQQQVLDREEMLERLSSGKSK